MQLLDLPDEILLAIGDYLDTQPTIASLVATNRRFYNIFLALLYRFNYEYSPYYYSAEGWAAKKGRLGTMKIVNKLNLHRQIDHVFEDTIKSGSVNVLEFLLDSKHPEAPSLDDLFLEAAEYGSILVMQCLLDRGVIMNKARDLRGRSAIFFAATVNDVEALRFLVDNGAEVEDRDQNGWSPLASVMSPRTRDASQFLVDNGADINANGVGGKHSVLYEAASLGRSTCVKFCLENGADPFIQFDEGKTALHIAALRGHGRVVDFILEHKDYEQISMSDDCFGGTPLLYAVIMNHYTAAKSLIKASSVTALDYQDRNGRTAVFYAARYNRAETLKILLEKNANPTIKDRWGASPIFTAVRNGHIYMVKCLLDVIGTRCFDERDDSGHGIVWWATRCGHSRILSLLTRYARESESDVEIEASEYFAEEKVIRDPCINCWCDICTRNIERTVQNKYQCSTCFNLRFIVCNDCFTDGQLTCEPGHREEKWVSYIQCGC